MDFSEFMGIYQAYKEYRDIEKGKGSGAPAPATPPAPAAPAPATPPAPAGSGSPTPDMMIAQLNTRITQMEQKLANPSMADIKPKGLEDIFNRMLGDPD